jgi:CrcB protein
VNDRRPELPLDPEAATDGSIAVALVVLGGAVGTAVRYAAATHWPDHGGWPTATMVVNLAGALVLGVLVESLARLGPDIGPRRGLRLLLGTGFCGGLTTYSTFAVELDLLIRAHRHGLAAAYAVVSVLAGVAAAAIGVGAAAGAHRRQSR